MPIYEYRCDKGHTFEVMQRMTDDPMSSCESCGAPTRRVFHPIAVHFKGSGFYNTDYGKRKKGGAGSDTGGEKKPESSSASDPSPSTSPDSKKPDSKKPESSSSSSD